MKVVPFKISFAMFESIVSGDSLFDLIFLKKQFKISKLIVSSF
jgi:hypothetical protein